MSKYFASNIALVALTLAGMSTHAFAAAGKVDYAKLHKLTVGLGYEDDGDKSTFVSIKGQGTSGYSINYMPDADGNSAVAWVVLNDINKESANASAATALLNYNDTHPYAFAISKGSGDVDHAILQARISAEALSPVTMRETMEGLIAAADETKDLWKEEAWAKSAALPAGSAGTDARADYDATEKAIAAVWARMPFGYQHADLVEQPSTGYSMYTSRGSNSFKAGEKIHSYVEPLGYTFKPADGGKVQFGVVIDLKIVDKDGAIVTGKDGFMDQSYTSNKPVRELCLDIALTLNGAPPGAYTIVYTMHDKYGQGRQVSLEQPVVIKAANAD